MNFEMIGVIGYLLVAAQLILIGCLNILKPIMDPQNKYTGYQAGYFGNVNYDPGFS